MSGFTFHHLFQSDLYADVDIVLTNGQPAKELLRIPAHRAIVCSGSEYFKAKVDHWQDVSSTHDGKCSDNAASDSSSSTAPTRPSMNLELDSADHEAAAVAVIASMYGDASYMKQLQQPLLVNAVVLADRLQAAVPTAAAVQLLHEAAQSENGLSAVTMEALASLAGAWPSCLLQLLPVVVQGSGWYRRVTAAEAAGTDRDQRMTQLLLSALGDLEQVFADQQLTDMLLCLPPPAVKLLLSSDELIVASEDTVLFAVQKYVKHSRLGDEDAAPLVDLVRCPHLSDFLLTALATTSEPQGQLITRRYGSSIRKLLSLVRLAPPEARQSEVMEHIPSAPASWGYGPRQIKEAAGGVELNWQLTVEELRQACQSCGPNKPYIWLYSPNSPPLAGMAWQAQFKCSWDAHCGGVKLGFYVSNNGAPNGVHCKFSYEVEGPGAIRFGPIASKAVPTGTGWGWPDFFSLGPMSGGWDDAAWAAKGLPAAGDLTLKVTMLSVL